MPFDIRRRKCRDGWTRRIKTNGGALRSPDRETSECESVRLGHGRRRREGAGDPTTRDADQPQQPGPEEPHRRGDRDHRLGRRAEWELNIRESGIGRHAGNGEREAAASREVRLIDAIAKTIGAFVAGALAAEAAVADDEAPVVPHECGQKVRSSARDSLTADAAVHPVVPLMRGSAGRYAPRLAVGACDQATRRCHGLRRPDRLAAGHGEREIADEIGDARRRRRGVGQNDADRTGASRERGATTQVTRRERHR